jgi:3-hydroxyacyl-[acyl-carrier-protein] dehydratase
MTNKELNIEEIIKLIPHRYPILLVDRLLDYTPGKNATGLKNVTFNEPCFMGHFPNKPIMPGVLIIEALAQTSAILVAKSAGDEAKDKLVYFISIDKVKFRKPVIPGDSLELKVTAIQHRGAVWKFEGKALVKNEVVTEASFAAMIIDNDDK